uniref:Uncharacterized protein n=1 Tax=viral metagenome TaxID=1070528 RepID=A0A6C0CQL0_9ZZZZ
MNDQDMILIYLLICIALVVFFCMFTHDVFNNDVMNHVYFRLNENEDEIALVPYYYNPWLYSS